MSLNLWIDPSFGASGDMLLGALGGYVDRVHGAGRAAAALTALETIDISERVTLRQELVTRCGLASHRMHVEAPTLDHGRRWSDIDQQIATAALPDRVRTGARATFRRLGMIEAEQHGVDIDDVHFHEVGALDAIVDIVGTWLLIDAIGPDRITAGPVGIGHGTVSAAHGALPLPAPATAALLIGAPIRSLDTPGETCTPTGAALLVTMADEWGLLPSGTIVATERGAGGRDPATHPNVVTVIGVEASGAIHSSATEPHDSAALDTAAPSTAALSTAALLIECNIDDVTPEVLAVTVQHLLDAGADDAWLVPIVMKKGRAATELRVLTHPDHHDRLVDIVLTETGALGCRTISAIKHALPRSFHEATSGVARFSSQLGPHGAKPELDDLLAASTATGISVRELDLEARIIWHQT